MEKILELPDWFSLDLEERDNWFPAPEIVYERDGKFYFDGLIGYLLKVAKIPQSIEVALDMVEVSALARLNYGEGTDEEAAFLSFEIESFALLWNADPAEVHGFDGRQIKLSLRESDTHYPFVNSIGAICNLFIRDGRFRVEPDAEFAEEFLKEVA